jgi:hypothetical protein
MNTSSFLRYCMIFLLCFLFVSCGNQKKELPRDPVFSTDIAPLIFKNCLPCHRKNGAAPFPLSSYAEVLRKAHTIQKVTSRHFMPPWPADPSYSHFVGEKRLTEEQITLISRWVDQGCREGDASKCPPLPIFPEGSLYGKPDLVLHMKKAFHISGNNTDRFLLMKFPYELPQDTFIRFIEFIPGKSRLVHHVNGFLIQYYQPEKKKNVFEGEPLEDTQVMDFPEAYQKMKLTNDDGSFPMLTPSVVNYLPGVETPVYPKGIGGFRMHRKGALFLKDIHYGPSPKEEFDSSYFNVFFSASPPQRQLLEFQMGTLGQTPVVPALQIPPDSIKSYRTEYILPIDWSVITINPHMHLLGKSFHAFALTPGGDSIPLIRITHWDFRWQYFYTFTRMLHIPAGSRIVAIGVYDNTKKNPLNPFHPPRKVGERNGSMRTTDEMFQFIINYVPYQKGDENQSLEGHLQSNASTTK